MHMYPGQQIYCIFITTNNVEFWYEDPMEPSDTFPSLIVLMEHSKLH